MPQIVGFDEAFARRIHRGPRTRVPYLDSSAASPNQPFAFLNQVEPGRIIQPHFHSVDQWQFIAEGEAMLGRDRISPYSIHFNRAYTPYGPLKADRGAMSYFDLYSRFSPGAFYVVGASGPQNMKALKQIKNRRPWQLKRNVQFPSQQNAKILESTELKEIPDSSDENGLFAYTLAMAPNTVARAPDPSVGEGQYIIGVSGSLYHEHRECKAYVVVFVEPEHGPFEVHAGPSGLEALILNFPRTTHTEMSWSCSHCGFVYDETKNSTSYGERWADLPDHWICPDCKGAKFDFKMTEVDRDT